MATVNHVGQGMISLSVVLPAYADFPGLNGTVTGIDVENDWLKVTWEGSTGGPLNYECEKFESRIGDNGLFLVLRLD
ncbi:MAG TPA: hypothetical protein VFT53_07560 [Candidatus Saccharimonadales bacterium]|nr:hypothetical protein [Candidatus Saccharimonadales bacterium]